MKVNNALLITELLILILPLKAYAQSQVVNLEEITVTSSRIESAKITRNIDVITSQDLETSSSQDLSDALSNLAPINIISYGGLGASKNIRMRGSTASQVLVLLDSRPINSARDGEVDLSAISLDNIERIEVLRGAGSSLYGAGAMGGTVNIITKDPPQEGQETELASGFGTFRTYTERLSHGARISKFGYLFTSGYQSSEGFRDNSAHNSKDLSAKLQYKLDDANTLTLNSGFYKSKDGNPGPIITPDIDDKQKSLKNFLSLDWNFKPDDSQGASIKIYRNYDRLEFIENSAGSIFDIPFKKDVHATTAKGIDLQLNKQLLDNYHSLLGFNYVANSNDSTASAKHSYSVRAIYTENQLDLFEDLTLNLGGRLDDYSKFGLEASPHLNLLYKINQLLSLRGNVSKSFRAPTFNDLYWPDEGWARGNPNLTPEEGLTRELSLQAQIGKYVLSNLTLYRSDYSDLINWIGEAGVWQPKNINSATIDGVELTNRINISDKLKLNLGYTYLSAKDNEIHKYLIYQPRHRINFSVKCLDIAGFSFEANCDFTGKRFHDQQNAIPMKSFFILGLNISRKFGKNFTAFTQIDNLLNKKYQTVLDYPMPGFSITNGIKLEF
ncbi:MAG: TonB-dependent receptor [Candidatus Omnitrophica bacterium]|nr:TonB-dependent receptor [Candidatus Omnitrophota bacterium]